MEELIVSVLSLIVLVPILYFLPIGLTNKGKGLVIIVAFMFANLGILAKSSFTLWQTGLIILLLTTVTVYLLDKKFNKFIFSTGMDEEKYVELPSENVDELEFVTENSGLVSNVTTEEITNASLAMNVEENQDVVVTNTTPSMMEDSFEIEELSFSLDKPEQNKNEGPEEIITETNPPSTEDMNEIELDEEISFLESRDISVEDTEVSSEEEETFSEGYMSEIEQLLAGDLMEDELVSEEDQTSEMLEENNTEKETSLSMSELGDIEEIPVLAMLEEGLEETDLTMFEADEIEEDFAILDEVDEETGAEEKTDLALLEEEEIDLAILEDSDLDFMLIENIEEELDVDSELEINEPLNDETPINPTEPSNEDITFEPELEVLVFDDNSNKSGDLLEEETVQSAPETVESENEWMLDDLDLEDEHSLIAIEEIEATQAQAAVSLFDDENEFIVPPPEEQLQEVNLEELLSEELIFASSEVQQDSDNLVTESELNEAEHLVTELEADEMIESEFHVPELETNQADEAKFEVPELETNLESQEELYPNIETEQEDRSKEKQKSVLQQQLFHTMVSQLHIARKHMKANEYEELIRAHLHPDLAVQDYYTFVSMLIEHYISQKELGKLQELLTNLDDKFTNYPILDMEIQYLYKEYCRNTR